jgi:cysteine desulfurase
MYAPMGVGALYVRPGVRLEPLVRGGGQEYGLRAGTENTAWAVALGAAARIAGAELIEEGNRLRGLRDRLHAIGHHGVEAIEGIEQSMLGRGATLEDVGNVAAFVASDRARTMTAATANISCGALIDR